MSGIAYGTVSEGKTGLNQVPPDPEPENPCQHHDGRPFPEKDFLKPRVALIAAHIFQVEPQKNIGQRQHHESIISPCSANMQMQQMMDGSL